MEEPFTRNMKTVFTIIDRGQGRSIWVRIGVGFTNRDGSLNLKLDALPINGSLQVREWEPADRRYDTVDAHARRFEGGAPARRHEGFDAPGRRGDIDGSIRRGDIDGFGRRTEFDIPARREAEGQIRDDLDAPVADGEPRPRLPPREKPADSIA
jgi:hypothetical protein